MRAAFITADVLSAEPGGPEALHQLNDAGLTPVVLLPQPLPEGERLDTGGFPHVGCPPGDAECWGDQPQLLLEAAARAGVAVSEAFLVCRDPGDVLRAVEAGCRPMLVLAARTLNDIFGPDEPPNKEMAAAADLPTAVRYMSEEAAQARTLGAFAFGPHHTLDDIPRAPVPTSADLLKVFIAVTVAGIAFALGIAYLLKEIYRTVTFPSAVYYVTLQFIPPALRGVLFIVLGIAIGFMVPRWLGGMRARRRYR